MPHRSPAAQPPGAALAVALALACACGGRDADLGPSAAVRRGPIERIVVATGTIEPEGEVEVRPRVAGIIERVLVEPGDEVAEGQVLVEIERDLLESQVREAEATLAEARVELRYARIAVERVEELERGDAASAQKRDDARSRAERAEAGLARAEANLQTLSTQLSYATVVSPLAGRILDVPVEEGSAVSPVTAVTGGSLLLSLAGTAVLHLEGLVDENEISRVALGQRARVRTEAFGERSFAGVVTKIAPVGQRIQNVTYFEVEVEITDPDGKLLRPRMSGDAGIVTEVVADALVVPETALRYRGEEIFVRAVTRASAARVEDRPVEVGILDGSTVQVLRGLEEGEEVLLQ